MHFGEKAEAWHTGFVTLDLEHLPSDPEALRALLKQAAVQIAAVESERDEIRAERDRVTDQNDRLRQMLRAFQRGLFGKRSEKLDPDQRQLALEDIEQAIADGEAREEKQDPALRVSRATMRRSNRGSLPGHLPRVEVVIEPPSTLCPCCQGPMHAIGEDSSERLDKVPAQYRVIVTRRPKYACRACEGAVVQAPAPARLVEGGLPTEALVADVLVNKYAWHLPLYRQVQMVAQQGVNIDRSTLAAWVGFAAHELAPLHARLVEILKASPNLFMDETRAPVLDPGRGRTKTGYLWAIARDDRPWGGLDPPAVAYLYAPGRGAEHAIAHLKGFSGILQVDGYNVYKKLADSQRQDGPLVLAHCWAHWRRQIFDIAKSGAAPIATEVLERVAALYAIEENIRGRPPEMRWSVRQTQSKPLVAALKTWLIAQLGRISQKSGLAEVIRYGLNHWEGLERFLDNGRLEIDSNTIERAMRPVALNRKNALFAGGDEGGRHWGLIASLIETCKLNRVEPHAYLVDVLTKLVNRWPASRVDELMPWAYVKPTSPV